MGLEDPSPPSTYFNNGEDIHIRVDGQSSMKKPLIVTKGNSAQPSIRCEQFPQSGIAFDDDGNVQIIVNGYVVHTFT